MGSQALTLIRNGNTGVLALALLAMAALAGLGTTTVVVAARAQTAAPVDDVDAQLRLRQAVTAVSASTQEVEQLGKALDAERQRVVRSNEEREINQATIGDLERKLAAARTRLQERQLALKAAQEARGRVPDADAQRRQQEEAARVQRQRAEDAKRRAAEAEAAARAQREAAAPPAIQGPWQIMQAIGLPGDWAVSCAAEVSPRNMRITFFEETGAGARIKTDFGGNFPVTLQTVDSVHQLSPTRLMMHNRNSKGEIYEYVAEIDGRRLTPVSAKRQDGTVLIQNGMHPSTGVRASVLEKCSN
jgi:hypothetical protein